MDAVSLWQIAKLFFVIGAPVGFIAGIVVALAEDNWLAVPFFTIGVGLGLPLLVVSATGLVFIGLKFAGIG